ncbi:MAG TPA: DUF1801 domain-containing protein [Nitrososphaera sp.]|jgi:uncharacterized protein YdhG (YjbR/CyaY superfamily)
MGKNRFETMDEYINTFPKDVQIILERVKRSIHETAPEAIEAISYGIPTFKMNGRSLVHFAAWKNHIGFYPNPTAAKAFNKELSAYKQGKGSVQFPLDNPIPYELIKKIVAFRVTEIGSGSVSR